MPQSVALLDMAAERRGAASLDGGHDAALVGQEPTMLRDTERIAVAAEDVRHLQGGTHRARIREGSPPARADRTDSASRRSVRSQPGHSGPSSPDRCDRATTWMMRMSVPLSSRWVAKLCRSVWTVTACRSGHAAVRSGKPLASAPTVTGPPGPGRETATARPRPLPIGAQNLQQPRRQHRVAIPAALAALDVDQHPLTVDRADFRRTASPTRKPAA